MTHRDVQGLLEEAQFVLDVCKASTSTEHPSGEAFHRQLREFRNDFHGSVLIDTLNPDAGAGYTRSGQSEQRDHIICTLSAPPNVRSAPCETLNLCL
jgi:hypothetical protein